MSVYIKSSAVISSFNSFGSDVELNESADTSFIQANEPPYSDYIPRNLIRRMSRVVKMSIACSSKIKNDSGISDYGAILVGTGLGCVVDSEKFLIQVSEDETSVLSPTPFIQSTHNTMAGQIALLETQHCENMTYSNRGHSFENALMDGMMYIKEGRDNVLVGGSDELSPIVKELHQKLCLSKPSAFLKKVGEGAGFFLLSGVAEKGKTRIEDLLTFEVNGKDDFKNKLEKFILKHDLHSGLDLVLLGAVKGKIDPFSQILLSLLSDSIGVGTFKEVSGEFHTASAVGLALADKLLQGEGFDHDIWVNRPEKTRPKKVLIYNNYLGHNHSLYLLSV